MYQGNSREQVDMYEYGRQQYIPDIPDDMEPDYDRSTHHHHHRPGFNDYHGSSFDDIQPDYDADIRDSGGRARYPDPYPQTYQNEGYQPDTYTDRDRERYFHPDMGNADRRQYDNHQDHDSYNDRGRQAHDDGRRTDDRFHHTGVNHHNMDADKYDTRGRPVYDDGRHTDDRFHHTGVNHHNMDADKYDTRGRPVYDGSRDMDGRYLHLGVNHHNMGDESDDGQISGFEHDHGYHDSHSDKYMETQFNGSNSPVIMRNIGDRENDHMSDTSSLYIRRRRSVHGRSIRRSRKQRQHLQSYAAQDQRKSFADGMKTLIRRRQTVRVRSEAFSRRSKHKSVDGATDSVLHHNTDHDEIYEDIDDLLQEEHLPSTKRPKTLSLKERLHVLQNNDGHLTTSQRATLLRDHILTKEPSRLRGVALRRYQISMGWQRFKNWFNSTVYQLELWSGAFKVIEGQFGTATMSYFRFLRWMMFLNLFMTIFMLAIVFLPFMLIQPSVTFQSSVTPCESEFHYRSFYLTNNYTETTKNTTTSESAAQYVVDVLQGTGWLENTELFYGRYHNKTSTLLNGSKFVYDMGLAYLFAIGLSFLLSFILLVKNSAKGFKQRVLISSSGSVTLYCNKVFGAWDYCISQPKTARLKHKNIQQDLMNELEYQRLQWKKESRTKREKAKLYSIRVVINLLVIAILGSSLYLIYFTNTRLLELTTQQRNRAVQLIFEYLPSIVIMLLGVIVPLIFNKVVEAEDYMPAFRIRITLIRTVLLRLASLGMLMISLYTGLDSGRTYKNIDIPCVNISTQNVTDNIQTDSNDTDDTSTNKMEDIPCWENYVGQQIYKLVILNFLVVLSVTFFWEFPRKLMVKRFQGKVKVIDLLGQQQFDLTKNVLDLIYLQTLCWLGMFFSPLIPAMCFVKCFLFFYVKKTSLLHNCLPMQQYGTSRSSSLFMTVLLLSFGLSAIPIGVVIGIIQPSESCGPFRVYSSAGYIMFDVITNLVNSWTKVKMVFHVVGTGGFMIVVAVLLGCLMTYYYIVGQAHYKMSEALREQLKVEGQDKQFLLAHVNEVLALDDVEEEENRTDDQT